MRHNQRKSTPSRDRSTDTEPLNRECYSPLTGMNTLQWCIMYSSVKQLSCSAVHVKVILSGGKRLSDILLTPRGSAKRVISIVFNTFSFDMLPALSIVPLSEGRAIVDGGIHMVVLRLRPRKQWDLTETAHVRRDNNTRPRQGSVGVTGGTVQVSEVTQRIQLR